MASDSSAFSSAFSDAADVLTRRVGLQLDPGARGRLSRCIVAASHDRGEGVADYVAQLDHEPGALQDLLDRVTVQETAFFRDPAQFEALASVVLPTLPEPTTIWSAACSNGQEPYSVGMLLAESGREHVRVVATDISTRALQRTREARYTRAEIKGVSPSRRRAHLKEVGDRFEVVPEVRRRVTVSRHNLAIDPPPFPAGACPVVLCRNVLIYFGRDTVARLLQRIADWMPPGGWLFLGYSESLGQLDDHFELTRLGDAFVYRRRDCRSDVRSVPPVTDSTGDAVARRRRRSITDDTEADGSRARPGGPVRHRAAGSAGTAAPVGRTRDEAGSPVAPTSAADETFGAEEAFAAGEAAFREGDHAGAVVAFRKQSYLDPSSPIAHLSLGLALEASGDASGARRAFAAARTALEAALDATGADTIEATLEGYTGEQLARLLEQKLAEAR